MIHRSVALRVATFAAAAVLLVSCAGPPGPSRGPRAGGEIKEPAVGEAEVPVSAGGGSAGGGTPTAAPKPRRPRLAPIPRARPKEIRASWLVRGGITSDETAAGIVADARAAGLNTLMVQVRGRGDAWYRPSGLEPGPRWNSDPGFDPLDAAVEHGLAAGLWLHGWLNVNVVADAVSPHPDPGHLANAHPEWLSLPDELAPELLRMEPSDPAFRARLSAWVKAREDRVEGLYGDPANPAYRAHVVAVVRDVLARYPLDGIHLDYIRYPGAGFGASRVALEAFRRDVDAALAAKERAEMARRAASDPLAYVKRYAARWAAFRRGSVDRLVREIAAAAREARPGILVSAAVLADQGEARDGAGQDWPSWLRQGWIDVACPMIYTQKRKTFESQLQAAMKVRGRGRIWAGIGAYLISPEETVERVRLARAAGAEGVVLFSHADLKKRPETLDLLRQRAFR